MTEYQKVQYKIRYAVDDHVCQGCGKKAIQIAHRISNTKVNLKIYGEKIINHNCNLVPVCGLECNSSFNIGNSPLKVERILKVIKKNLNEKWVNGSDFITKYINGDFAQY